MVLKKGLILAAAIAGLASAGFAQGVEPGAGNWRTFVISSGKDYRVPPPPNEVESRGEAAWVKSVANSVSNPEIERKIRYWDAGAPMYRWVDLIVKRQNAGTPTTAFPHRVFAYVALAMHDATVAAWDAKYFYNRPRPNQLEPGINARVAVPNSPSYPSEHAAAAYAAAAVLASLLPAEAAAFETMAEEAGHSRLYAGVQYPSDFFAGRDLGRKVADQVIARMKLDGSDGVFAGSIPTGPCNWVGTNPGNATMPTWKPIILASPGEFRSAAPPACTSTQVRAEADVVKNFARTFTTNSKAFYYQSPEGSFTDFHTMLSRLLFEDQLDQNPPRAARAYAALAAVTFDTFIASNDSKYTYWYLRPHMFDSGITPLFPVPNFPSYPSNHSALSTARTEILAYFFPDRAAQLRAWGKEAGDSRIWAGIHYEMDNQAGVTMGKSIAQKFITWLESK